MKYAMTCSCGHEMSVDAENRDEAVSKMKMMMGEQAIAQHMAEKHPGEPMVSVGEVHAGIEKDLQPA